MPALLAVVWFEFYSLPAIDAICRGVGEQVRSTLASAGAVHHVQVIKSG